MFKVVFDRFLKLFTTSGGRQLVLGATVVLLLVLFLDGCGALKAARKKAKQNELALKEAVVTKNKLGEFVTEKVAWIKTKKELKSQKELYTALKAEKGKVKVITRFQTISEAKEITIDSKLIAIDDSTKGLEFQDSTEFSFIKGVSTFHFAKRDGVLTFTPGTTTISENKRVLDLVVGIKKIDGVTKIFVTPKSKGITIVNLDGAIIEDNSIFSGIGNPLTGSKPSKHSIGIHLGYGIMPSKDPATNNINFKMGPVASIGYNYTLFRFPELGIFNRKP